MANTITEVRLLAVPLENDYMHTLYFDNVGAQTSYFQEKTVKTSLDFSYQRKDNIIRYPAHIDDLLICNYVMYKNSAYSSKYFYAFITKMEYINDGRTDIYIETDVIQTWLFDYTVQPSFIEREHVNDDTIGLHTVPEGLETGEYICNARYTNTNLQNKTIIMGCTLDVNNYANQPGDWNLTKEFAPDYGSNYNGLFSGLKYFAVTPAQIKTIMKYIAYEGQEDAVVSLFYAPTELINIGSAGTYATEINSSDSVNSLTWDCCDKPTKLNGYTPSNNKLLTAPYVYLMVDNGGGTAVEYFFEKFSTDDIKFTIYSVLTSGMSIRAVPLNYNGVGYNDAEGINLSKYATCSWNTDAYTSWLTQSAVNVGLSTVGTIAGTVGALSLAPVTGGASIAAGASVVSGAVGIASTLASANERMSTPPQLHGNTNTGDVATARGDVTFKAYSMSIKKEFAQIIDGYFNMFGYKVNTVKYPNKNHRQNYWYTKCIDASITGKIPMDDLRKIKACYNNGITFWKNPDNIRNYSAPNRIV